MLFLVKAKAAGSSSAFAVDRHVGGFMNVIQADFSLRFFLASLVRIMMKIRQDSLVNVGCVLGHLCRAPEDWGRDLFHTPSSAAEFPVESRSDF